MSNPQEITIEDIKFETYKVFFPLWLSDEFADGINRQINYEENATKYIRSFKNCYACFRDLIDVSDAQKDYSITGCFKSMIKKGGFIATAIKTITKQIPENDNALIYLYDMLIPIVQNNFKITCKPEYAGLDQDLLEAVLKRFFATLLKFVPDTVKFELPYTYVKPKEAQQKQTFSDHIIISERGMHPFVELRDIIINEETYHIIYELYKGRALFPYLKLSYATIDYEHFSEDNLDLLILDNCTINKTCIVGSYLVKPDVDHLDIELNHCIINGAFKYYDGGKSGAITLNHCVIESGGSVEIKDVKEFDLLKNGGCLIAQSINIKNCIFKGKLDCSCSCFDLLSSIQYTTFYDNFIFKDSRFDKDCVIEHLAFPSIDNADTNRCKKVLIEALKASGRTENELIKDLELKNEEKETWGAGFARERDNQLGKELGDIVSQLSMLNTSNKEDAEYHDQIKRNRITTKNAAKYLGIGISTLEKKRANDKRKIGRDSIPCILLNGTIYYRKDALDAYLFGQNCSDWGLLADLQEKYKEVWRAALNYKKK